MGVAIGDYDRNGTMDVLVTTFSDESLHLHLNGESEEGEKVLHQLPNDKTTQAQYHVIMADALRFRSKAPEAVAEYQRGCNRKHEL